MAGNEALDWQEPLSVGSRQRRYCSSAVRSENGASLSLTVAGPEK